MWMRFMLCVNLCSHEIAQTVAINIPRQFIGIIMKQVHLINLICKQVGKRQLKNLLFVLFDCYCRNTLNLGRAAI